MNWTVAVTAISILATGHGAFAKPVARFEIQPETADLITPISLHMEGVACLAADEQYVLRRVDENGNIRQACQLEQDHTRRLWFLPDKPISIGQTAIFELTAEKRESTPATHRAVLDDKTLSLHYLDRTIVRYYHALHPVPEGVDPVYRRSGFLHPLWSPAGNILTRIQPPDHYHHYGLWNPWTKVQVEGREVDFWNLREKQGTVRFSGVVKIVSGPVFAGFKARQEHVMFPAEGQEKTVMCELLDVRTSSVTVEGQALWVVDFTSTLQNSLDSTVVLKEYRYGGGIGFRATADWTKENSAVLTSEGRTRADADGSRARWCDVRGTGGNGQTSGILFLSHCGNREHPEPMRVWPMDANGGRGDMFFEFCPIRLADIPLEPGQPYVMRYRMIVYDGILKPETAEILWQNFVKPPLVKWQP